MKDGTYVLNIIIMFVVLAILASVAFRIFGVKVQENFLFCNPGDCKCACSRNMYSAYCNSPYLKDGPEALCNCKWNKKTLHCDGTRAPNARCVI